MRHLAEVAGVSSRTPYNLFDSKTDVLFAIMLQSMGALAELDDSDDSGLAVAALFGRLETLLALTDERQEFF